MSPLFLLSGAAILGLVWAETTARPKLAWLFKPVAASCFIALALFSGALESSYGQWLLAGLVMCWGGDVLLLAKREGFFKAGLFSFLVGHVLYTVAFFELALNTTHIALAVTPALILGLVAARWLWPHLKADMKAPVCVYIVVICAMITVASGTVETVMSWLVIVGAWGIRRLRLSGRAAAICKGRRDQSVLGYTAVFCCANGAGKYAGAVTQRC